MECIVFTNSAIPDFFSEDVEAEEAGGVVAEENPVPAARSCSGEMEPPVRVGPTLITGGKKAADAAGASRSAATSQVSTRFPWRRAWAYTTARQRNAQ